MDACVSCDLSPGGRDMCLEVYPWEAGICGMGYIPKKGRCFLQGLAKEGWVHVVVLMPLLKQICEAFSFNVNIFVLS